MNNPLRMNDTILLTIKRLGINGEGIGYFKRLAVFVDGALPGEVVEVKITDAKDKYAYGVITKTKQTSPHRITPLCPYFDQCGGCQLQHLSYDQQLYEKRNLVIEAFERYFQGDLTKIKFNEAKGMDDPWRYRNKSSLPVRHDGKKVVAGMYQKDSNRLVFIEDCLVETTLVTEARNLILDALTKANVDIYHTKTHEGSLKYIVIRGFETTKELQVTFIMTKPDRAIIEVLKRLPFASLNYSINADPKSIEIFGNEIVHVAGKSKIDGKLGDLLFHISPKAFFQLNIAQTHVLYEEIKRASRLNGYENVVDCYCGIGSIGLMLAPHVQEVRGIDTNKEGIEDAKVFANINKINNASFYAGNILPYLDQFKANGFVPDVIILNPPRKGLDLNLIHYLQANSIKRIIYVSCNPATLAKNINHMQKEYSVKFVTPVDMFPQTANIEAVCLLERR